MECSEGAFYQRDSANHVKIALSLQEMKDIMSAGINNIYR